jgi:hypothetical protein
LKFVYGNKNELDPRVMPSTKKLKKTGKKLLSSAKPELAILEVNWACARTCWAALGEPTSSRLHGLELYSRREVFKKYFN